MKYLTIKEIRQQIVDHDSYDIDDFINAYEAKKIKIYLKHSGFVVRNTIDSDTNTIKGYYPDSIKPLRGLVEPLDDICNQDIVSLLQGNQNTIIYATIDEEIYTLLRARPTDTEAYSIESYTKLYTESDFLIEREQFESIFSPKNFIELQTDKSLALENQKLLRIIGGMLAGIKHSSRYKDLKQNTLYELMAEAIDTRESGLSDSTVKPIFKLANDAVKIFLIKK
ncbi:hypothetical protein [Acinetobacter gerneri]|uniref:hypothetical protein n=1 Tax=Acinetobacter gerneri TaxID=202952 RepID=UPI003A86F513